MNKGKIKKLICRILLISMVISCLWGITCFCYGGVPQNTFSGSKDWFCTCCGKTIKADSVNEAWRIHSSSLNPANQGSDIGRNSITHEECKKGHIVAYTEDIKNSWQKTQDNYAKLSPEDLQQVELVNEYRFLKGMVDEIFSVNNTLDKNTSDATDFFNTYIMMNRFLKASIETIDKFSKTSLYVLFVFVGILFMFVNFAMNFFQNTYNTEGKTLEQYLRFAFQIILMMFLIVNSSKIVMFFLYFFTYILDFVWKLDVSAILSSDQSATSDLYSFNAGQSITYYILVSAGITSVGTLDKFKQLGQYIPILLQFFIPYIICVIGKFGILFAIISDCVEICVYCIMFPIACGDVNENLRQSKLVKYSKHIMASILNLVIIVVILIVVQALTNSYLGQIINIAQTSGGNINFFNFAIIASMLQLVKVVACNGTAKTISSKVSGD